MYKEVFEKISDIESMTQKLENLVTILNNSIEKEDSVGYLWDFIDIISEKFEQLTENIENLRIEIGIKLHKTVNQSKNLQ